MEEKQPKYFVHFHLETQFEIWIISGFLQFSSAYLISHLMAEESVELPVTPEETKLSRVEIRRHSADKASSGNSDEKIVPHYLRASTGSCHDVCKYGGVHKFNVKERRSIPSRATRKKLHQSSEESIGGIMMSVPRLTASVDSKPTKKMPVVKLTKSVEFKTMISDTSDANKEELQTKSSDNKKHIRNEGLIKRNKTSSAKLKPSLLKSHTSPSAGQETSSTVKDVESPSKSSSRKVESPSKSISKKGETLSKSTSKKVEIPSKSTSKKVETPSNSTSKKVETPSNVKTSSKPTLKVKTSSKPTSKLVKTSSESSPLKGEGKMSEKLVTSVKPISVARKTISSVNSSEGFGGQRNKEIKIEKRTASSKAASRKLMTSSGTLLSPRLTLKRVPSINSRKHKSLKIVSHLNNQQTASARKVEPEERNKDEVEEKTLYVIKMESENKTSPYGDDESSLPQLSPPNFPSSSNSQSLSQEDQEESEYTTSEFEEDSVPRNHEEYMQNGEMLEAVEKGKPRKGGIVYSEDKDCQMLKLKFRRGRMIENKIENNSPRRLKFRRAKVSEKSNLKVDALRKSFKRRDEACADGTGSPTGPEKVVLRHQDMQNKKDARGLFNNVIEETASKLAETRKSKVKALVGAFETVISLQEKKPSSNTIS
ncbi:hypothetical protein RIF29_19140 [Crotalaria pallida]|uniref:Calmodulin-binding domain-containing protein n=1 Tax=Crotalaria pallida TaxID=3830 RepID=A0AAN9F088_CROPI